MADRMIQQVWLNSYADFQSSGYSQSDIQRKTSLAILDCKSGNLGVNVSQCPDCGHNEFHNNSCRNRNCPSCQAVMKEIWVDKRRAEVIDSPYFHVVFTLPHDLNPLIYRNQQLLYGFFHRCCAETLLELSADKKHLGATPGIIQVLHTWDQEINYHVHMHCIVSGGGLTPGHKLRKVKKNFFLRVEVLRDKFKGKFLAGLQSFFQNGRLFFSASCERLRNSYEWAQFRDSLYQKDWCPYIKETFNGFGNAIEYLGRYTHKIAISNSRILSVDGQRVSFSARGRKPGEPRRTVTLTNVEFIRRYLMHVLPSGFQKIRYYGFLNNRYKTSNLKLIFTIQGHQRFQAKYTNLTLAELLKAVWNIDIRVCPKCGCRNMQHIGRAYGTS
ncbi:MAG: IS91 family transposase [Lachnospiraceae bacterium]|nr:IS91 family transposase [Lachnospiraceae bacterium]MDE7007229.1 IS91 family transposase [Lachnospiraceae bacterium]